MPCNAKDVAQYVVNYFIQRDNPVTNLKLQKLLYFAWIEYFNDRREYLFNEPFEAWVLEPVVPEAYYEFCVYGADVVLRFKKVELSGIKSDVLNNALEKYANDSAYTLVDKSHRKGGAWGKRIVKGKDVGAA